MTMTHHLKIAWRTAWKSKLFTSLDLLGLVIGFSGFILVCAYIHRENSYDAWNPNYDRIYRVVLEDNGKVSDLTPSALAPAVKARFPEVAEAGRIAQAPFEVPFISDENMFFLKGWYGADRAVASIFAIEVPGINLRAGGAEKTGICAAEVGKILFPSALTGAFAEPRSVALVNAGSGMSEQIHGISPKRGLSNLDYEYIAFTEDIAADRGDGDTPVWQTYLLVRPGTDIRLLTEKINALYHNEIARQHKTATTSKAVGKVYLDPLKNLHLRPRGGSDLGYRITVTLGILAGVILLLACINFANLMLVQAHRRSKEIAVAKVLGVSRGRMVLQFLTEVFARCLLAVVLAGGAVFAGMGLLGRYYGYEFEWGRAMLTQLGVAVLLTTLVAGLYPALVLAGAHPAVLLKTGIPGGKRSQRLRHSLLGFQFAVAFVFICTMLVIGRQMSFVKHGDKGFNMDQVVHLKSLSIFNRPGEFEPVRAQLKAIPGVLKATVATHSPGNIAPVEQEFEYRGKNIAFDPVAVDYEYFELLGMSLLEGRLFSPDFAADTAGRVILNASAAALLGSDAAVGKKLTGCGKTWEVVGVVRDSRMFGFEKLVKPTVYTMESRCGVSYPAPKTEILVKLEAAKTTGALREIEKRWAGINPRDGQYFIYNFLEERYAKLHVRQEQLQRAFTTFTFLVVGVALLGLFGMAAYSIRLREKEVSIRKVLGAGTRQLVLLLNRPFLRIVGLAVLTGIPIAWWIAQRWLETFAYRVDLTWGVFASGAVVLFGLAFLTVGIQALKASFMNPAARLKEE